MNTGKELQNAPRTNRGKLAHYRDFTLGVLAGMCLLFGYGFASEAFSAAGSPPDGWIALGAFAGMALCVILSPNRMLIVVGSFATISGLTILKLFSAPNMKSFVTAAIPLSITALLCLVAAFMESYRRS